MKEVILKDGEKLHIVWEKDGVRTPAGTFSLMEQGGRPPYWEFVTDGDFPTRDRQGGGSPDHPIGRPVE